MNYNARSRSSMDLPPDKGSCCECFYPFARWLPVAFVLSTAVCSYYAYAVQFAIFTVESVVEKSIYLTVYHILFVMFIWSYLQTVFSRGNGVPDEFRVARGVAIRLFEARRDLDQRNMVLEAVSGHLPLITRTTTGLVRYCDICEHVKPDRAHHCRVCDMCAIKMDHHCPWINNCVGFANYKFFVLFLGYMLSYCLFILFTTLSYFIARDSEAIFLALLFFTSVMFSLAIGVLFFYHVYLISVNRTTMEAFHPAIFRSGFRGNGFSAGSGENFREVFGDDVILRFLPVFSSLGDGYTYTGRVGDVESGRSSRHFSNEDSDA